VGTGVGLIQALAAKKEAEEQRSRATDAGNRAIEEKNYAVAAREQLRQILHASDLQLVQLAWQSNNLFQVFEGLERQRPRVDEADLRGFEWHYWNRLARPEVRSVQIHPPPYFPAGS